MSSSRGKKATVPSLKRRRDRVLPRYVLQPKFGTHSLNFHKLRRRSYFRYYAHDPSPWVVMTNNDDPGTIHFQLGGLVHSMSVPEFGVALGLYTDEFLEEEDINTLPHNIHISPSLCWKALAPCSSTYDPSRSKASALPLSLRYLHCILAHTLTRRRESTDVVTTHNAYYLSCMANAHVTNLAYFISFAIRHQTERHRKGVISIGPYVTRLARHFGLLNTTAQSSAYPDRSDVPTGHHDYVTMRMIERQCGTDPPQYRLSHAIDEEDLEDIPDDVPPQHEEPSIAPPRERPAHAAPPPTQSCFSCVLSSSIFFRASIWVTCQYALHRRPTPGSGPLGTFGPVRSFLAPPSSCLCPPLHYRRLSGSFPCRLPPVSRQLTPGPLCTTLPLPLYLLLISSTSSFGLSTVTSLLSLSPSLGRPYSFGVNSPFALVSPSYPSSSCSLALLLTLFRPSPLPPIICGSFVSLSAALSIAHTPSTSTPTRRLRGASRGPVDSLSGHFAALTCRSPATALGWLAPAHHSPCSFVVGLRLLCITVAPCTPRPAAAKRLPPRFFLFSRRRVSRIVPVGITLGSSLTAPAVASYSSCVSAVVCLFFRPAPRSVSPASRFSIRESSRRQSPPYSDLLNTCRHS
ncbi:hypothetical protein GOBAR_AA02927 [Gossypium barbadense]|uniref:Uncharacterized protein n=1 Tax=Gossypium barbadense TaxID=3634 RepID=A0A2P5YQ08_GOSBA|nr:hypothetical protein GOBAR_AA02927 [Gossypium barbadense]